MNSKVSVIWRALNEKLEKAKRRNRRSKKPGRSLRFEQCEDRRMLAAFTVNSLLDNGDGSNITFREAVVAVNQSTDAVNSITFSTDLADALNGGTILLDKGDINTSGEELLITKSVTIDATMLTDGLTIQAHDLTSTQNNGDGTRVFNIALAATATSNTVTLAGLNITGGDTFLGGGGIQFNGTSSATNDIHLTIRDSVIAGNSVQEDNGGGIYLSSLSQGGGTVQIDIIRSSIEDNATNITGGTTQFGEGGGGIYAFLSGNDQDTNGAVLNIVDSTISNNVATQADGGGLWFCPKFGATLNVTNTTISGNSAPVGEGGGVWISTVVPQNNQDAIANFDHVTITDNVALAGGGLFSHIIQAAGPDVRTTLNHTIVSGNRIAQPAGSQANNLAEGIEPDSSYNLIGPGDVTAASLNADSGTGNIDNSNNDPGLLALNFYGGPTKTHMLKASSLAVDVGDPLVVANQNGVPEFDQRGTSYERVEGAGPVIDIGAVEFLLGDYNFNGVVDAADYTVWRDSLGQTGTDLDADGNNDGVVSKADYDIWTGNFGAGSGMTASQILSAFSKAIGDYNSDGVVDHLDYGVWTNTFNSTTDLRADGNGDDVVDAADYTVWRDQAGSTITTPRFQLLTSTAGVIYVVTTTVDEFDGDHTFGDLSLREAVVLANAETNATILLLEGRYTLDRTGIEAGDASYNDLDISSDVLIVGDGAGVTVIEGFDSSYAGTLGESEVFHVAGTNADFTLTKVTVTGGYRSDYGGTTLQADIGSSVHFEDVAIVNSYVPTVGIGVGIYSIGADVTILGSVFTNLTGLAATSVVALASNGAGSLTIGDSIFALNSSNFLTANVYATSVAKTNLGNNLYDDASGGFFDITSGVGDHLGTPDYVVTTVADTFDHVNNVESLSVREAIDLSNQASGQQEIWLPAWTFALTRDRQTYGGGSATDIDTAFGDLDISDDLIIRGVTGKTSVAWEPGIVDAVFDLLGDYNNSGQADYNNVSAADSTVWTDQNGSGSGTSSDWEVYAADGDDDGDVDQDDRDIWVANYGNSLDLFDVAAG